MNSIPRRVLLSGVLCLVAVTLVVVAGAVAPPNDRARPTVDVAVNGEPVAENELRLVSSAPTMTVSAAVGANATAETRIETITVRVDGRTYRSYTPDARRTNVTIDPLELEDGNNTVRVIVEDSENRLATHEFTLGKDDVGPWIWLRAPYESPVTAVIPNGTVEGSLTTLDVRVSDYSGVRRARIDVDWENESQRGGEDYTYSDPGVNITQEVLLGYGNNSVTISAEDRRGNRRAHEFNLHVEDGGPPEVSLDLLPNQTTDSQLQVTGTVTDDVWLRNVTMNVTHLGTLAGTNNSTLGSVTHVIRPDTGLGYDRSGLQVAIDRNVDLGRGPNQIRITATDHLGNTTNRTILVERIEGRDRSQNVRPTIEVDRNLTAVREDGRLRLVATVTDEDFNLASVEFESEAAGSGELVDYERFDDLDDQPEVPLDESVTLPDGRAIVRVRAIDELGERRLVTLEFNSSGPVFTPRPTPTPTPTSTPNTTTTANVTTVANATTATTATSTPTLTSAPTPSPTVNRTTNATSGGGLPLIGALPIDTVIDLLLTGVPFVVGVLVFATVAYFVLRRVRGQGEERSS